MDLSSEGRENAPGSGKVIALDSDYTGKDDYAMYIADMILELETLARKSGRKALAEQLAAAHTLAKKDIV